MGQRRQNELSALTADQTRQTMAEGAADRNALQRLAQTWGATTSIDDRVASLRNSGRPALMTQADALEKQGLDKQRTGAQVAKDQAEAQAKQAEIKWKLADRHMQRLPLVRTPEDAVAYIDEGISEGTLPAEGRERSLQALQAMGVEKWKAMLAQAAIPVLDRFKEEAQTLRTKMSNDTSRANNSASNAVQMRGQNISAANAAASRAQSDQQFKATQASGGKAGVATEAERNAAGYLMRMQEATKLLDQFEGKGSASYGSQVAGAIPLVGGLARRAVMSPEQQQYRQAQEDWVRAKLRKESGASIAADEMEREIETYFPMPGDGKEVREQKRKSRLVANDSFRSSAGRAAQPGAANQGGVVDFGSLK